MRILFDQGTPAPLRRALTGHSVSTAYEMDRTELSNGSLLRAADAQFDALITTDRNLRYQQNIIGLRLAILVLPTTNWLTIRLHAAQVAVAVAVLRPGDIVELQFSQ
jgi:hypothetical protein